MINKKNLPIGMKMICVNPTRVYAPQEWNNQTVTIVGSWSNNNLPAYYCERYPGGIQYILSPRELKFDPLTKMVLDAQKEWENPR
jgi:hypothetical protein